MNKNAWETSNLLCVALGLAAVYKGQISLSFQVLSWVARTIYLSIFFPIYYFSFVN